MRVVKAPEYVPVSVNELTLFLAGSIEMGKAENWQEKATRELSGAFDVIFSPRRDDWDSSWVQDISNPQFNQQVNWELDYLKKVDFIFMYFQPGTMSPITLMELGFLAGRSNLVVVCPTGFWRKGNVQIMCYRNSIPLFETLEEGLKEVKKLADFY